MIKLRGEDIPPLNYVVEPILPEGLVLWAGRPKARKSWTALDLTYCVENDNFLIINCRHVSCTEDSKDDSRIVKQSYHITIEKEHRQLTLMPVS